MDLSDDNWKPPSATYLCQLSGVQVGNGKKNAAAIWVKPQFTIVDDGDFQGKVFTDFFYIEPGTSEPTMGMRGICRLATCIAGHDVKDPAVAYKIVRAAANDGLLLSIEVYRQTSTKNGREYTNLRFLAKAESTEVAE
jgi:hypothetical protein